MIEELTAVQRKQLKKYKKKYIEIGLSTTRINKEECINDINKIYTKILGREKPRKVVICRSPYEAWEMICLFKIFPKLFGKIKQAMRQKIGKKVGRKVWEEVEQEVRQEVREEVGGEVEKKVGREVLGGVRQEIRWEVEQEIKEEVWREVRQEIGEEVWREVAEEVWQKVTEEVGEVGREVGQEVWREVGEAWRKVWEEAEREVGEEAGWKVREEIEQETWEEVRQEIGEEIWREVQKEVRKKSQKKNTMINFIVPYLCGSFDASYFMFYSFFAEILNIKISIRRKLKIYANTLKYGFIFPLKNVCFVSEKPIKINRRNKKLHADYEPALSYADGFCLWRLNGYVVPEWLVMTKPENLDVKKIMELKNVEVRKEAIKKLGTTLLVEKLDFKVLDKKLFLVGDNYLREMVDKKSKDMIEYELLEVDLKLRKKCKLFKMQNPSLRDVFHYEFVAPECQTVMDALEFRNGTKELPVYLS